MATELNMNKVNQQQGFVLVTSLIMLSLLTLLSVGMYMSNRSSTQISSSAQKTTEAYYFAETAVNYISWGLNNDAEFDSYSYTGTYLAPVFKEPSRNIRVPSNASLVGDYIELLSYLWDPGPIGVAGDVMATDSNGKHNSEYTAGQVMYFDNSPLDKRAVCFQDENIYPKNGKGKFKGKCIDVKSTSPKPFQPSMYQISTKLPRYIKLDIQNGKITPSIPALPHHSPPVVGEDIPLNGAIVWMTAADLNNSDHDLEIFPLDPAVIGTSPNGAFGSALSPSVPPQDCVGDALPACPCVAPIAKSLNPYVPDPADLNYTSFMSAVACDANTGKWLKDYSIVAYAIGYVNGKPSHMLRAIIK